MRFGVREICNVVFKTKAVNQMIGKLKFPHPGTPVIYFDSLKTSSLEGQASTVYAQGGRGNPRLIAWDGERTLTFTMEDALISPLSFSILSGAGFFEASASQKILVHVNELKKVKEITPEESEDGDKEYQVTLTHKPAISDEAQMFVMAVDAFGNPDVSKGCYEVKLDGDLKHGQHNLNDTITMADLSGTDNKTLTINHDVIDSDRVMVDYYIEKASGAQQIDIEAGKFGGAFYVEADTLWRDEATSADYPAQFIIPRGKVQSNFTFSMASSGDPSTFTFTMDAMPDYVKGNNEKKVLAAIQIIEDPEGAEESGIELGKYADEFTYADGSKEDSNINKHEDGGIKS